MSDFQTDPDALGGSQPTPSPPKGTSPLRLVLLLLIFGIALAGLLYDYTIARPSIQKADKIIQSLLDGTQQDPNDDGAVTMDEVQSLLGCTPNSTKQLPNGLIEKYSWRSGLPYRTYDLYVVYSGQKLPLLHSATTNEEPGADNLPPMTKFEPPTKEDLENFKPRPLMGAGAGTGGGPPRAKKGSSGKKRGPRKGGGGGSMSMSVDDSGVGPPADAAKQEADKASAEPAKDEPGKETPPPTQEPPKEVPPPTVEPAKDTPPPTQEPAKEVPPPTVDPPKTEGDGQ